MDKVYGIKCKYLKNRYDMDAYECKHPEHKYVRDFSDSTKEDIITFCGKCFEINKNNDCKNFEEYINPFKFIYIGIKKWLKAIYKSFR